MKMGWLVISIFVFVHVLAAALFVGWLGYSGRLSEQRLQAVHDLFTLTIEQEQDQVDQAELIAAEAQEKHEQLVRLRASEDGPRHIESRLENIRQSEAVALARLDRYRADVTAMRVQIDQGKQFLATQQKQIATERQQYLDNRQRHQDQQRSADFRKTVRMFEHMKPELVKQLFGKLLDDGQIQRVVTYLAAMNLRKATKVLSEFKEPQEIAMGVKLLEMLRKGGFDPTESELWKKEL